MFEISMPLKTCICYCRILQISTEELQHQFGTPIPENIMELLIHARNFVEFCSYKALDVVIRSPDYLSDKEVRRLTFDMMLAWEAPIAKSNPLEKESQVTVVTF